MHNNEVSFRIGACSSLEMVNVLEDRAYKFALPINMSGWQLWTQLLVRAWVKDVSYSKNVWVDVHVLSEGAELIGSETLTLEPVGPTYGDGFVFELDSPVYRGSGASGGSFWYMPNAWIVEYRLYFEVDHLVFTDGILHKHEVKNDSVALNWGGT